MVKGSKDENVILIKYKKGSNLIPSMQVRREGCPNSNLPQASDLPTYKYLYDYTLIVQPDLITYVAFVDASKTRSRAEDSIRKSSSDYILPIKSITCRIWNDFD